MTARDRVLDAYESLLVEAGPAAATLDAVASAAQVSKGGLLYHFPSKEALVTGLLERLRQRGLEDAQEMRASDSAVATWLRGSAPPLQGESGLSRTYVAALRIAGGDEAADLARAVFAEIDEAWFAALLDELGDPARARLVQLVGDGLYLSALTGADDAGPVPVDDLLAALAPVLDRQR
ncbi:TetR/AcrR family transcriptional regulator [Pseudokineococcus marinus]|uniref:TetR/AcrR family transcriptional regulator n=1 Tax=Pseudokineococcus marinus TaxID=351215 RepID=A0A849BNW5_9ACTN|nr:TetR/AcrR family transcriptional regulator [Pseudokineococcus marinus]NNH22274.1 TetR/AcrR family transcriptional regulator [Pseudokineococcus marinus]